MDGAGKPPFVDPREHGAAERELRAELRGEMKEIRDELRDDIKELRADIKKMTEAMATLSKAPAFNHHDLGEAIKMSIGAEFRNLMVKLGDGAEFPSPLSGRAAMLSNVTSIAGSLGKTGGALIGGAVLLLAAVYAVREYVSIFGGAAHG